MELKDKIKLFAENNNIDKIGFCDAEPFYNVRKILLERAEKGIYILPETIGDEYFNKTYGKNAIYSHMTALYFHNLCNRVPMIYDITVTKKYYGVCLMQDVLKVREEVLTLTEKHLSDAIKYEQQGLIAKSERLHAEVAKAKAERDYKAAKKDLNVANSALYRLIKADGVNADNIAINPQSRLFMSKNDLPEIKNIQTAILENSPLLKQAKAKTKIAKAIYNSKKADYMPPSSYCTCLDNKILAKKVFSRTARFLC